MIVSTEAIILHSIKHSDNSVIVHAYTQKHGRMSYVVNGARSKKSVLRSALLQPLSIVSLQTEFLPKKNLQRIKESSIARVFNSIPFDPSKNAICLFIAELLYRSLKEPHVDSSLYAFLTESIVILDEADESIGNFHLVFLVGLSRYLGFEPQIETMHENYCFDLQNGIFTPQQILSEYLNSTDSKLLASLLSLNYATMHSVQFQKDEKYRLLKALLAYYKYHLSNFSNIKSVNVMVELFN